MERQTEREKRYIDKEREKRYIDKERERYKIQKYLNKKRNRER